ncbi:MAG: N-acetylmuramoyl-L-alanine amidase, partial [Neisseriaceae bacterium]|nr:N-acetylmuramoyl-L-alanine amidase [Neisseriaceae bacterium]
KLSLQRILIIIAICLVGVFFAVPNVVSDKTKLPKWWQPINLGLDLQGGSSLLLQVKMDDVLKDKMATLEDVARQELRKLKVRYQDLSSSKDGVTVNQSTKSFEGYSMYVSKKNKKYRASLCFAQRLGFRLKPLQRDPAYFHKEHEGLPLVVKEYGIYERDIPLLRDAEIPAVQLKIGVVTDPQDEAWINDDQYRRDIENAVIKTIRVFKQYCSYW